ncbi:MAG: flavodoxin family protein [Bacteroidales bacterium]|nr:flavodoxin family protein [Bacteroidales bacterium]
MQQCDDINTLLLRVLEADVLAFCTPVNYYSISGQMKTLFGRLNPLYGYLCGMEVVYMVMAMDDSHTQPDRAIVRVRLRPQPRQGEFFSKKMQPLYLQYLTV